MDSIDIDVKKSIDEYLNEQMALDIYPGLKEIWFEILNLFFRLYISDIKDFSFSND